MGADTSVVKENTEEIHCTGQQKYKNTSCQTRQTLIDNWRVASCETAQDRALKMSHCDILKQRKTRE